jgi:uncharacterized membrane protein
LLNTSVTGKILNIWAVSGLMEFKPPFGIFFLLIALPLLVMMVAFLFVGMINQAFQQLGIPPPIAVLLLFAVLFGSFINIPVYEIKGMKDYYTHDAFLREEIRMFSEGKTTVSMNLGGAVIPLIISIFAILKMNGAYLPLIFSTVLVALVCYRIAKPVKGVGIAVPAFIPPVIASLTALVVAPHNAVSVAFVSGVLGVLIGADLMNIRKVEKAGVPMISIGGAGTFDGIFLTGVLAVMLVAIT